MMRSVHSGGQNFDVLIIGGGVIGCSIAYHLASASEGRMKIGVLERNGVGSESSGGAAGMLAAQIESGSPDAFLDLALRGRDMFRTLAPELKDVTGIDIEYVCKGIASIAYQSGDEAALRQRYAWQKKAGLDCEWLGPESVSSLFPFLKLRSFGGLFAPADGQVNSSRLVAALEAASRKRGVTFIENESLDVLKLDGPRLEHVDTSLSRYSAGKYVVAAGAWSGKLTEDKVPVGPVKGQILIFQMPPGRADLRSWDIPLYVGNTPSPESIHCYFVPKKDGHILLGATMERTGVDLSENKVASEKMAEYACGLFPDLETFPFKSVWVGLRPGSPDGLPVLGLAPGSSNVYVAGGHLRNGILLSAVTGRALSELILEGRSSIPLEAFSPDRFRS